MFCSNCGTERSSGNYCSSCGMKFQEVKTKPKPKVSDPVLLPPQDIPDADDLQETSQMSPGAKKGLTIGAVLIGVLMIIGIVVSSNSAQEKAKIEASASASASAQEAADEQAAKDAAAELVRQQ